MELMLDKAYALLAHFLETADNDMNCDALYHAMYIMLDLAEAMAQESYNEDYED